MKEKNNGNQKTFSSSVLYYPTIEFHDETWLKSALLTWEKIYRIVPVSYTPFDSDDVKRAIDIGCIENINLSKLDLTQTASSFQDFWDNVPFIPAALESTDDTEARLHPDKVDARIRPILDSLSKSIDPEGFLRLSPEIANAYMLLLSETISRRRQIPKLTDNPDMFAIMHYFANDGNFDEWLTNDASNEGTTTVVLENVLPDGISEMDMKEVIKFRNQFKSYREDFRNSIMSFTQQIALIEDQEFAQIEIDKFVKDLTITRESLSKAIANEGRKIISAGLSIGLPTTLTAIGILALGSTNPFTLSQIGTAGLIGAVATIADFKKSRRKKWSSNESLYYMQLHKVARSGNDFKIKVRSYEAILNEFIND